LYARKEKTNDELSNVRWQVAIFCAELQGEARMTGNQTPIENGFSAYTTTSDVIRGMNLVGRVAIVTGGYAGLGLEAARTLASAGARVIVPARDVERARRTMNEAGVCAEIEQMDLTDTSSINEFVRWFLQTGLPLHILINSAGIMASPVLEQDSRGNELQFSTNHLGHFQLTCGLWPALTRAQGARVVAVSSLGHHLSDIVFNDINFAERPYDGWLAYGQSKTANILFAHELDKRGRGHDVRAFSLHPGGIVTNLAKHMSIETLKAAGNIDETGRPVIDPARDMKSIAQGAATHVWCAVSPQLERTGGVFCMDCNIAVVADPKGDQPTRGVAEYALNEESASKLWSLSEALTGVRFDI
jgi:NAD(P)-dependent dehydrogenase (short-subunit alcohol dehydrogenase family)